MRELREIIIAVIVICTFAILFSGWSGNMFAGSPYIDNSSYTIISQNVSDNIEDMTGTLHNTEPSLLDSGLYFLTAPFQVVMMLFQSMNIITSLATDVAIILHLPPIVIWAVLTILSLIIIFGVLKVVLRTQDY